MLTKLGLSVTFAEDGAQAVAAISQGIAADLILMDLQMPVMNGFAATEQIRQWECTNARPRRPIIALTADAFEADRQHCLDVGMDDVLTKPIVINDVVMALRRWLPQGAETLAANASSLPARETLDVPRVVVVLDTLFPLLQQNKFNAIATLKEIEVLVAGTEVAADIAGVAGELRLMRFDRAFDDLTTIAKIQGWKI